MLTVVLKNQLWRIQMCCMSSFCRAASCLGNHETWCCISQVTLRLSTNTGWELVSWGSFRVQQPKSLRPVIKASLSLSLPLPLCDVVCCLRCFSFHKGDSHMIARVARVQLQHCMFVEGTLWLHSQSKNIDYDLIFICKLACSVHFCSNPVCILTWLEEDICILQHICVPSCGPHPALSPFFSIPCEVDLKLTRKW